MDEMSTNASKLLWGLVIVVLLTAPAARAKERGVFAAEVFQADMKLTPKSNNRKEGPKNNIGPVPAGLAWDGEQCSWLIGAALSDHPSGSSHFVSPAPGECLQSHVEVLRSIGTSPTKMRGQSSRPSIALPFIILSIHKVV